MADFCRGCNCILPDGSLMYGEYNNVFCGECYNAR